MKTKIKASDVRRKRSYGGQKRPLNMNFHVNFPEYEYIARRCFEKSIADETRQLWFREGWEQDLEKLRIKLRADGYSDINFMHPQQKAALYRKQRKA